ncbi:MAG: pyruvate carboxylase subunit B [Chloroflexi bacterium]|nr:pyruvate carboxylase subunit B [Chloroflexota bacterium]
MNTEPVKICDLTLRDGHQSLLATRMRTGDMLPVAEAIDRVGYWAVEVWGGATFDACIRFLEENPWDRLRRLRAAMPHTPLMMLLRGQNIVGYRHYPDDVVERFIVRAKANGIDVFRIFDALNDVRNLRWPIEVAKREQAHVQAAISYTIGPPYSVDYFVDLSRILVDMGADSICIKDMAGLLTPYTAHELVKRLKAQLAVPVHLHSHSTSGMATSTHMKAIEAGVDIVDTVISSLSMTTSHPPTESIVAMLQGEARETGLRLEVLSEIANHFSKVRRKYAHFESGINGVDIGVLQYQIPGGMLSNMVSQLREQGVEDRIDAVLAEVTQVRAELGYPPLVTPSSQIVGTQATLNVVLGKRYSVIPEEIKQYIRGYYGQPPAPISPEVRKLAIGDEQPIDCRPADLLAPGMPQAYEEIGDLAREEEDVLSYALFPQIARPFLERRARGSDGNEPVVAAVAGVILNQLNQQARQPVCTPRAETPSAWQQTWRAGRGYWSGLLPGAGGSL